MASKQGEATACVLRQVDALRLTAFKARLSRQRKTASIEADARASGSELAPWQMPQRETLLRLRLSSAITRGGSHADDHTEISATPSLGGANRAVRRAQRTGVGTVNHGSHGNPPSREQHFQES